MSSCICTRVPDATEKHSFACSYQNDKEPRTLAIQNGYSKYHKTPPSSLISHLMILSTELRDKALATTNNNDRFWAYDAGALVIEAMVRYNDLYMQDKFRKESLR